MHYNITRSAPKFHILFSEYNLVALFPVITRDSISALGAQSLRGDIRRRVISTPRRRFENSTVIKRKGWGENCNEQQENTTTHMP